MCGILLVKSNNSNLDHTKALKLLSSRGPDLVRSKQIGDVFIAQTVLHITGNREYYNKENNDSFLAYNGEIYNTPYRYSNDIELVHDLINNHCVGFKDYWGMWSFIWTDGKKILYASDPQGEKVLYKYEDNDLLIISTEIRAILTYVKGEKNLDYNAKHWCFVNTTCYKNINKVEPGFLFRDRTKLAKLDSIYDWVNSTYQGSEEDLYSEFSNIWKKTIKSMTPKENVSILFSGGVDSSIIMNEIPNLELITAESQGKDKIVEGIEKMLSKRELENLRIFSISKKQWGETALEVIKSTKQPLQSWNFVNQWILFSKSKNRIVFTGTGADELFGGYEVYKNYSTISPYSSDPEVFQKALRTYDKPFESRLLSDYIHQVSSCDARGIDLISGNFGIESRNPFMAKPIVQFALNLPREFRIGKPFLKRKFLERWNDEFLLPKEGFSGHCNDSLKYMDIDFKETGNRNEDWKRISIELFRKYA